MTTFVRVFLALSCATFMLTSCESGDRSGAASSSSDALNGIFEQYLAVKDALVNLNAQDVSSEARELAEQLNDVDTGELTGDKQGQWAQYSDKLKAASLQLAQSSELEQQKQDFVNLTAVMEEGIRNFGLKGKTVYKQHCPMAFEDKGASWLSDEEKIRNPYEAETMIGCGSVQEKLEY